MTEAVWNRDFFNLPIAAADRKRSDGTFVRPTSSASDGLHKRPDADLNDPLWLSRRCLGHAILQGDVILSEESPEVKWSANV